MDLTSIFFGRKFNQEEQTNTVNLPKKKNYFGKDWVFDETTKIWAYKPERVTPFPGPYKNEESMSALNDYYKQMEEDSTVDYRTIVNDDDEDPQESWVSGHLRRYEREEERRSKLRKSIPRYVTADDEDDEDEYNDDTINQMKLYDDNVLTYEDEVAMIETYHRGEIYVDKNNNLISIVNREKNKVEFIRNAHLGKLRNDSIIADRIAFLTMMNWKPGNLTIEP